MKHKKIDFEGHSNDPLSKQKQQKALAAKMVKFKKIQNLPSSRHVNMRV
jgi:hypothetical protein